MKEMWRMVERGERIEKGRLMERLLYMFLIIVVNMEIKYILNNIGDA